MMLRKTFVLALGVAALSLPIAAAAQTWGGDYYDQGRGYAQRFQGYPEFRGQKDHIRREIWQGLREGWLDEDQARDANAQLWRVQRQEFREFQEHGWRLPGEDREEIRGDLGQIDAGLDRMRDRW